MPNVLKVPRVYLSIPIIGLLFEINIKYIIRIIQ